MIKIDIKDYTGKEIYGDVDATLSACKEVSKKLGFDVTGANICDQTGFSLVYGTGNTIFLDKEEIRLTPTQAIGYVAATLLRWKHEKESESKSTGYDPFDL